MTAPAPPRIAAFFDMDGTLLHSNIVVFYVHLMTYGMTPWRRRLWTLGFLAWIPVFLAADKFSRAAFNRMFYRRYRGADAPRLHEQALKTFPDFTIPRLFADAERAVREHQRQGHRVVFVTGTADFIAEPLAEHLGVEDVFAVTLEVRGGRFTGELLGEPLSDGRKARTIRAFAEKHGIDLPDSFAYGDSLADAPMLETVGNPVVVNPSKRMRFLARRRGWKIVRWT